MTQPLETVPAEPRSVRRSLVVYVDDLAPGTTLNKGALRWVRSQSDEVDVWTLSDEVTVSYTGRQDIEQIRQILLVEPADILHRYVGLSDSLMSELLVEVSQYPIEERGHALKGMTLKRLLYDMVDRALKVAIDTWTTPKVVIFIESKGTQSPAALWLLDQCQRQGFSWVVFEAESGKLIGQGDCDTFVRLSGNEGEI